MTTSDNRSDSDLLLAYGRDGDEAAFETLARRHVNMIFSVSLRRAGDRQLAEEATRHVLLSLSNKALKLAAQESSLGAWLHTSTRFEVSKLQRREIRIRQREQTYAAENMNTPGHGEDEAFQRLYPVLDQAIDQLRKPDREVIVRRYLQEQDFRRIGESLGISEDAAQKRTSRAFERLNHIFRRKAGVTVSAAALAAGIGRHCTEAAPAACLDLAGLSSSGPTAGAVTTITSAKITAVAAGVLAFAGAVAYLATQANGPEAITGTVPPPSSAESAATGPRPDPQEGAAENAPVVLTDSEREHLEALHPHPEKDGFTRRLAIRHDQLLADLTDDLGLDAAQAASLKEVLDLRLDAFRASLDTAPNPVTPGTSRS